VNIGNSSPLYNSRIFQIYVDYLSVAHPHVRIQEVLDYAIMTSAEMADAAHWFTQEQSDRFYQIVVEKTGETDVARRAGRFAASSAGLALFQQYVIGLLNTDTALLSMAKIIPLFTRGAAVEAKKLSPGKIEIISTPQPDVEEKPYQCENRLGSFEAVAKLFTNVYGQIDHPLCFHRGDGACHYIVSWTDPPSLKLKLWRNYSLLGSVPLAGLFYMVAPPGFFLPLAAGLVGLNALSQFAYARVKIKELEKIIESSHSTAQERIEMANASYSNSLLVQEIGQATAAILNIDELMRKLAMLMHHRLSFDRGLIMLADEKENKLVYSAGYGHSKEELEYLQKATFQLNKPDSKGFFVRSFLDRKHLIINNAAEMSDILSPKSRKLLETFGVRSMLCLPIVYKDTPLGILAVDNVSSKTPIKKTDINLLEGIASHIAIGINNARSFQKLQESENRYRQTLESIEEGYFEIDLKKQLVFINKAFAALVGRPLEELPASPFEHFFTMGSVKQLDRFFENMLRSKAPVRFAQLELGLGGKTLPVDLSVSLIVDQGGRAAGFRGFLRNAQDRLQLELERKELEKKLQQAQKLESIGTLAGGIAHNFNNWLAGILGNIGLIKMAVAGREKVIERISKIEAIIDNAAKMNRQLLSYARGGNYEIKPIDLNEVIREVAYTFATAKKDVVIKLELDPELRIVEVDRSQIEQVLWNLYANAADAMPDGGTYTIESANVPSGKIGGRYHDIPSGKYVRIRCTDTGSGILPAHMDIIFEPFFTTKKDKGTGLGLASCYGIIKAHSGYIDVDSQQGVGSTFTIYLPSVEVLPESNQAHFAPMHRGHGTVLIVDDEEMVLETHIALLSKLGYTVYGASSGEEVLEKYADRLDAIDIVIIDMVMPGMRGGELFARLKKIKPALKALLCSGYSVNQSIQAVLDQGCEGFLQKPFTLGELSSAIEKMMADAMAATGA
jgi:PAS domain S-box-containing protein